MIRQKFRAYRQMDYIDRYCFRRHFIRFAIEELCCWFGLLVMFTFYVVSIAALVSFIFRILTK